MIDPVNREHRDVIELARACACGSPRANRTQVWINGVLTVNIWTCADCGGTLYDWDRLDGARPVEP